ncbi:MAG: dihydropteroate synthase [Bacteroidales bacterium]|nr:dihydropteroate synthase [Bacteroidales bacterium]
MTLNLKKQLLSLNPPVVMGILNITDDSFFDGGKYTTEKAIVARAAQILEEGAALIDIGAVSTRPGAAELDEAIENERIKKTVRLILKAFPDALLSIDTWRASVAEMAVNEGAAMINDVSGGAFDANMLKTVAALQVPYCLMHTSAKPDIMQQHIHYNDLLTDILQFTGRQLECLNSLGVHDVIIDPGFGFGKTQAQNYHLMNNLEAFHIFGRPLLVGISRKSMIYKLLQTTPEQALNGTSVLNTLAIERGAHILRVHDVKEAVEVIKIVEAFQPPASNCRASRE